MNLTLSHSSALLVLRRLRSEAIDVRHGLDCCRLASPESWSGRKWSAREFESSDWKWQIPSARDPIHVLVPYREDRTKTKLIRCHAAPRELLPGSVLWLDASSSVVSPGLLFVQMARDCTLSELVLLGNELCGNFTCDPYLPDAGDPVLGVPAAITASELQNYVNAASGFWGIGRARQAAELVVDNAWSIQEAILATIYSLPTDECGYGMGPLRLNRRVDVGKDEWERTVGKRLPDIMFPFAPVGINYDGGDHLDLTGLIEACERSCAAR